MRFTIILAMVLILGCNHQPMDIFEAIDCQLNRSINDVSSYDSDSFRFSKPNNWQVEVSRKDDYVVYIFQETYEELTDEILGKITKPELLDYYNFEVLTITSSRLNEEFDEMSEFMTAQNDTNKDPNMNIAITSTLNSKDQYVGWIKYDDNTFRKDSLICQVISTLIVGEENYLWAQASVIGEVNIHERMCDLLDITKTIEVN